MTANYRQKGQLWFFGSQFSQKQIFGPEFQETNVGITINILEIPCVPIFRKKWQLCLFGSKFAQSWISGSEFQKSKSGLGMSTSKMWTNVSQFSIKTNNFDFLGLNLGKLPIYVQYFGSNIVKGVAESWVEVEMSWVEVEGAEGRLKWAGWRWMKLGGDGCTVF